MGSVRIRFILARARFVVLSFRSALFSDDESTLKDSEFPWTAVLLLATVVVDLFCYRRSSCHVGNQENHFRGRLLCLSFARAYPTIAKQARSTDGLLVLTRAILRSWGTQLWQFHFRG